MPTASPATTGRHHHARSSSHPLPRIFSRKKSAGNLGGYHDTDVPLDEDLVPVDETMQTPTRGASGKKSKAGEDEKLARRCMCCFNRVNVPRHLHKFRCMCCLTINDLVPLEEQPDEGKDKEGEKRPDSVAGNLTGSMKASSLSVERAKTIIDRCIMTYLERRGRGEDTLSPVPKVDSLAQTPDEKENPLHSMPIRQRTSQSHKVLPDDPLSGSPPEELQIDESLAGASAAIRDFSDFDQFAYIAPESSPPKKRPTPHGPGPPGSSQRGQVLTKPNRQPPPPLIISDRKYSQRSQPTIHSASAVDASSRPPPVRQLSAQEVERRQKYDRVKMIFRPLEDHILATFGDYQCLNASFSTIRPTHPGRARSESGIITPPPGLVAEKSPSPMNISQIDAKTLLLGDIGENSTWWTGKLGRHEQDKAKRKRAAENARRNVSSKSPNINWTDLEKWYEAVHAAGEDWRDKIDLMKSEAPGFSKARLQGPSNLEDIENELAEAREHSIRALLKVTENVLKRPTRPLLEPDDLRFLLIILANPSIYPSSKHRRVMSGSEKVPTSALSEKQNREAGATEEQQSPRKAREGSQHSGILKRIFGLLAGSTEICHRYLLGWFSRFDEEHFTRIVDLVASFITYRIARRSNRPQSKTMLADGGLIPDLSGSAMNTSAQLHSATGLSGSGKKREGQDQEPSYAMDWQIKAAAKLMSLLFAANNIWQGKRRNKDERVDSGVGVSPEVRAKRSGQLLHTSSFYNTLLDYQDMIADFRVWESKKDRFAFCQYPLFLSMGMKIKILEYDARRQMELKAREAYFNSVIGPRTHDSYFHLRVRRDCMVDDSLRQISEATGTGQEELKKGLRVHFAGEEGVDAGGLRKEWFLMLVRDIFDPNHGLFVYNDESNTCYFNPNSFETSDQYYLVGALLGLAIYNSTILDIALPPFAFRKLLAAAPISAAPGAASISSLTGTKGQMTYTLSDLAEYSPSLAAGLQQLLDFEGDVQETYCRDFVAAVERYGTVVNVPLIPNGENTPVTNTNRQDFVEAYVRYLLDTAVTRQFEPFKRGFFQVCAGNALSLFRAEEIELLVRGSDEALDIDSLRAVAVYENWRCVQAPHETIPDPAETVPVIKWFWELFSEASPEKQRKLLTFVTGTDRIPAVGATSLILRIVAGGDGKGGGGDEEKSRFPIARTCFNMLILWRYDYRKQLEQKLWRAVDESEGFGLK